MSAGGETPRSSKARRCTGVGVVMRVKRGQSGVGWLDAVERDGGEVLEQGLEAVRWVVVAGPVGGCFGRGSPRSPRAIPGLDAGLITWAATIAQTRSRAREGRGSMTSCRPSSVSCISSEGVGRLA